MEDNKYQPVSCSVHDIYEIAIMRQVRLDLTWRDDNGVVQHQIIKPVDLKVINGAEYLVVELTRGDEIVISEIRLDKIITAN